MTIKNMIHTTNSLRKHFQQMSDSKNQNESLLKVSNLKINFYTTEGIVHAVNNIDFSIKKGKQNDR